MEELQIQLNQMEDLLRQQGQVIALQQEHNYNNNNPDWY